MIRALSNAQSSPSHMSGAYSDLTIHTWISNMGTANTTGKSLNCDNLFQLLGDENGNYSDSTQFTDADVTGWEKCAVRPGLEPGTHRLQGECSTDWSIRLPDTLSPQWWLSVNRDTDIQQCRYTTAWDRDWSRWRWLNGNGHLISGYNRAGDHVIFVYGNFVSQQIVFAIFSINRSNVY